MFEYIFARKFFLITDHQPLQFIFGRNKGIPISAAARITRWAVTLAGYDYTIEYRKGSSIANADGLFRLPMDSSTDITDSLFSFNLLDEIPLNAGDIAYETKKGRILVKILDFTRLGFPSKVEDEFTPYFRKKLELSIEQNCLMLGSRIVIP
ncbi:uncharacterized protein [Leptinotarsa decemlineata]|uniref:uncharacterized protein n=1 Tax=Leptinotarsa decemlineata TaxID=7539 RepID=UPI003D3095C1